MQTLPKALNTPTVTTLYKYLNVNGQTRFVGGCVRAVLLGEPITDIDLATTLTPQAVIAALKPLAFTIVPLGLEHGTILAIKGEEQFEITTLRKDIATNGRHAKVRFTTDFKEDALRRDLTINALYMDHSGHITDFFTGVHDLHKGYIRFVGNAQQRLKEDYLRALRFVRFYGRYGKVAIDQSTKAALQQAAPLLKGLSRERITEELFKILAHPNSAQSFTLMAELTFLNHLNLSTFNSEHHKNFKALWPKTNLFEQFIAGFWHIQTSTALQPFNFEKPLLKNPYLRLTKAQKRTLKALHPQNTKHLHPQTPHYSAHLLGGRTHAQALWQQYIAYGTLHNTVNTTGLKQAYAALNALKSPFPPCPLTGKELLNIGFTQGRALGHTLKTAQALWLQKKICTKAELNTWACQQFQQISKKT